MGRVRPSADIMAAFSSKLRTLTAARYPERGGGRKLAADLNISPQQWSQWVGGKRFPLKEQRLKLAAYFGIDEAELLPAAFEKTIAQGKSRRSQDPVLQATGDLMKLMTILNDMQFSALKGEMPAEQFTAFVADILRFANFALYEMNNNHNKPTPQSEATQ